MGTEILNIVIAICLICAIAAVVAAIAAIAIWRSASKVVTDVDALSDSVARLEASSESEERHMLRPRDLGGIHDKINVIATEVANLRGTQDAQYKALFEQLRILQENFVRRPYPGEHRG